jgi:hypothetical protein
MKQRVSSKRVLTLAAAALALLASHEAPAGGTIANGQLMYSLGSSSNRNRGDFISANNNGGLNTLYEFYIEVPPGQTNLEVDIYDRDVLAQPGTQTEQVGGVPSHLLDRIFGNTENTSVRFELFDPAGNSVAAATFNNGSTGHDDWLNFHTEANPEAGHWLLTVSTASAVTTGDDAQAYGIRAHNGDPGTGGTEYNVYSPTYINVGTHVNTNKAYTFFPYITSGCDFHLRDFDAEDNAQNTDSNFTLTSRGGFFSTTGLRLLSNNNVWESSPAAGITGFASAGGGVVPGSRSEGYGIWRFDLLNDGTFNQQFNYIPFYFASITSPGYPFTGGNFNFAPDSSPEENTFRIYLPRDGSTVANPLPPNKTYLRQKIYSVVSGPNPPTTGVTTRLTIEVEVVNPEAFAVTFSPTNTVTVRVPAAPVVYRPPALITQGSFVSQPADGASNADIIWNPGTLAAGTSARLRYNVDVTPTTNGQVIPVTGTPASNGTTATFLDITGNASQPRATYTFGPICGLTVTEGGFTLAVNLLSLTAEAEEGGPVAVSWATSEEIDNAGFLVYEAQIAENNLPVIGTQLTADLIPAGSPSGAEYLWVDQRPWSSDTPRGYYLADIDLNGTVTYNGPVWVNNVVGTITAVENWKAFDSPAQ